MNRLLALVLVVLLGLPALASAQEETTPAPPPAQPPAGSSALQAAYQKEVAFLVSERAALQQRLQAVQAEGGERLAAAQRELDTLQGRLLSLQREADAAEELLTDADRAGAKASDSVDLLASTVDQARTTLTESGVEVEAPADESIDAQAAAMGRAFAAMEEMVAAGGAVRTEPGSFFLADGTRTDGEIVRVGRIASYGVSASAAGPLAPAGQGRLKLAPQGDGSVARALAKGQTPPPIATAFLHESLAQAHEERAGRTLADVIDAGGPVGLVILALGAIALLLLAIRAVSLFRAQSSAEATLEAALPPLQSGDLVGAVAAVNAVGGSGARVMQPILGARERSRAAVEDVASESLLAVEPMLARFGTPVQVIAAVAPLLGLLGTVTGMIATFEVITNMGTGNPKLLSGGISEALVTTQLGLVVAIPTLLLGNLLGAKAERVRGLFEQAALVALQAVDDEQEHWDEEEEEELEPPTALRPEVVRA